jgi:hypothetical protein
MGYPLFRISPLFHPQPFKLASGWKHTLIWYRPESRATWACTVPRTR